MRQEANRAELIAARMSDLDTQVGQVRGLVPGFILCERSPQRVNLRQGSSKFVIRPWEHDHLRLIAKGLNPLVSGDGGTDLDGRPLFLLAAERYPDRCEEFMAEVKRIDEARARSLVQRATPPPTQADREYRQAAIIAEGVKQGLASTQPAAEQPPVEQAPKRGDAEPRPTKARE